MGTVMERVIEPDFASLYSGSDDPWGYRTRWYEERKRALVLAALPQTRFERAFEPGCGNGELTAMLAPRCGHLLAVDVNERAVALARSRVAAFDQVEVLLMAFPETWPSGYFDLIVVSELGYYLSEAQLREVGFQAAACLHRRGVLLACHWRRPLADGTCSGDRVHERLSTASGLSEIARYVDEDFVLTAWSNDPRSIASREGLA